MSEVQTSQTKDPMIASLLAPLLVELMMPPSFPVERVRANVEAQLKKTPNDPETNYVLGRVYYTALCAKDPQTARMYSEKAPFRFSTNSPHAWDFQQLKLTADANTINTAKNAFKYIQRAIDLKPKEGLYHLTKACVFEASANIAPSIDRQKGTKKAWLSNALKEYQSAFTFSREPDLAKPYAQYAMTYEPYVSEEAANGIIRLDPKGKDAESAKSFLKELKSKPGGPITPIVFSLEPHRSLADLIDSTSTARFDLDGTGISRSWGWVKPETAFLVWRPNVQDRITSGRQLFGTATFWLIFENGYDAMAALDNNGDGWLREKELEGIAAWRDRNQNGRSESGEVISVQSMGVRALSTRWKSKDGESFVNPRGIVMNDGRIVPSYDWVTHAVD